MLFLNNNSCPNQKKQISWSFYSDISLEPSERIHKIRSNAVLRTNWQFSTPVKFEPLIDGMKIFSFHILCEISVYAEFGCNPSAWGHDPNIINTLLWIFCLFVNFSFFSFAVMSIGRTTQPILTVHYATDVDWPNKVPFESLIEKIFTGWTINS